MSSPLLVQEELSKPLDQFNTAEHITSCDRPLWLLYPSGPAAYETWPTSNLLDYNPHSSHHVFTALVSRLSLNRCTDADEAVFMAREDVNSHLRVVIHANIETGVISTVTPSDPIVADAVAHALTEAPAWGPDRSSPGYNWGLYVITMGDLLFSILLFSKG